jgi:hypothetical protein
MELLEIAVLQTQAAVAVQVLAEIAAQAVLEL